MKIDDFIKSLQEIAENHPGIDVFVRSEHRRSDGKKDVKSSPLPIYEKVYNEWKDKYEEYVMIV